ncbi:growth arrest-specific protein 2 [Colossoma macropomum]|uniref:growth arrest-specific protein 2 n=1 Tax=Colossoma macropomum TaxID=42526 RepID=UPI0018655B00|nr:growth arrest-specific protein 2 [Colossoma macropomum]
MNGPLSPRREPVPDLSCLQHYSEWLACRHEASLLPMKEDLALWLNTILGMNITAENFMNMLETGVVLCQLAEELQERMILASNGKTFIRRVIRWTAGAAPGSFFARDNTANFLYWCRKIGVGESHLFESEDLVLHRHPRNVCLCLMQLGRIASKYGIDAPELVKLERELEKEENGSLSPSMFFASPLPSPSSPPLFFPTAPSPPPPSSPSPIPASISPSTPPASPAPSPSPAQSPSPPPTQIPEPVTQQEPKPEPTSPTPPSPVKALTPTTRRLSKSSGKRSADCLLDDAVKQISEDPPCRCPVKFCIEKQPKGRYRVGDKVLYVRMLNDKHVMVRVGGGWETFGTYLLKHDPCRTAQLTWPGLKPCKPTGRSPNTKESSRDSYLVVGTHSRLRK